MSELGMQAKVGALVLFSLSLLVAFIFVLGDFSLSKGFEFNVEFENAGGLKPGADVAVAGINVGTVKGLEFFETQNRGESMNAVGVRATVSVEKKYAQAVREDSSFFITTRGVLGEPYIEIVTASYASAAIKSGASLRGVDPPRIDMVVAKAMKLLTVLTDLLDDPNVAAKDLLSNAAELLRTLQDVVSGNRADIDGIFKGANTSLDRAALLLGTLNVVLGDGEPIREMIDNTRVASADLRATSRSARRMTQQLDARLDPILGDVEVITRNTREVSDSANRLVVANEARINETIANVHKTSDEIASASTDARAMVADLRRGEGTVGQLIKDREIYDDLKEIMRQIKRQPWKIIWKE